MNCPRCDAMGHWLMRRNNTSYYDCSNPQCRYQDLVEVGVKDGKPILGLGPCHSLFEGDRGRGEPVELPTFRSGHCRQRLRCRRRMAIMSGQLIDLASCEALEE